MQVIAKYCRNLNPSCMQPSVLFTVLVAVSARGLVEPLRVLYRANTWYLRRHITKTGANITHTVDSVEMKNKPMQ